MCYNIMLYKELLTTFRTHTATVYNTHQPNRHAVTVMLSQHNKNKQKCGKLTVLLSSRKELLTTFSIP